MSVSKKLLASAIFIMVSAACYACSSGEISINDPVRLSGTNTELALSGLVSMGGGGVRPTGNLTGMLAESAIISTRLTRRDSIGYPNGSPAAMAGSNTWTGSIPEPSTLALFGTGLLTLGGVVRRKRV